MRHQLDLRARDVLPVDGLDLDVERGRWGVIVVGRCGAAPRAQAQGRGLHQRRRIVAVTSVNRCSCVHLIARM